LLWFELPSRDTLDSDDAAVFEFRRLPPSLQGASSCAGSKRRAQALMSSWSIKRLASLIERNPDRPPQSSDLRGWPFLTMVLIGISISVPFFAFGGQLGQHAGFAKLVPAIALGSLLLGLWGIATGYVGVTARLPTAMIVRRTFGGRGALAIVCLMVLISFSWFGIQTQILVKSVAAILDTQLGVHLDERIGIVLIGALIASTAVIGVKAMGRWLRSASLCSYSQLLCRFSSVLVGAARQNFSRREPSTRRSTSEWSSRLWLGPRCLGAPSIPTSVASCEHHGTTRLQCLLTTASLFPPF
jgi:cytosine/uracil/thiamine/allantoin permease